MGNEELNYLVKEYKKLEGYTITGVTTSSVDEEYPGEDRFVGLVLEKEFRRQPKKIAWVQRDPEGNGRGFLMVEDYPDVHTFNTHVIATFERPVNKSTSYNSRQLTFSMNISLDLADRTQIGNFNREWEALACVIQSLKVSRKNHPEITTVLGDDGSEESGLDYLVKIDLAYTIPEKNVYGVETNKAFDFMSRSKSKYYFQPDQRDDVVADIVKLLGVASKTQPYSLEGATDARK
jgi:hypothetical protein